MTRANKVNQQDRGSPVFEELNISSSLVWTRAGSEVGGMLENSIGFGFSNRNQKEIDRGDLAFVA